MTQQQIIGKIHRWLKVYASLANKRGYVIGVSGGVDSALVSTLCAMTGLDTCVVTLPIKKINFESLRHCEFLEKNYKNVVHINIPLTDLFEVFSSKFHGKDDLALANTQSRLRMTALYHIAAIENMLVAGTGNKVEDYGVGFFTKYGDGGVDVSPIGDLLKTEVRELAKFLEIAPEIVNAAPTDGLWDDNRTDEQQIGATYAELEWAMNYVDRGQRELFLPDRQREVLKLYQDMHEKNLHKMKMPPICTLEK